MMDLWMVDGCILCHLKDSYPGSNIFRLSLKLIVDLFPGKSGLTCCSGLQHNTTHSFYQTNDGVMMYHC